MNSRYPNITIKYEGEEYLVEKIYVTELNWLMVRMFNARTRMYTTRCVGTYDAEQNFITDELRRSSKETK